MKALKVVISNHPVPAYFTMTFAISWGGALLAIVFVGYLTAFRVLMVWVYDRTESLVVVSFAFAAAVWVVVGVIAARTGRYLERGTVPSARGAA